jgi:hypothetical protein
MKYASCPTGVVNAPVEVVLTLLTHPEGWGDFYNVRITAADPAGPAVVGQTVFAQSGTEFLHLKLRFRFTEIDALNYKLGFDARFPFGVTVREDMSCIPLGQQQCRVNYHCGFGFPTGWCGAVRCCTFSCAAGSTAVRQTRWPGYSERQSDFIRSLPGRSRHNAHPVSKTQPSRILPL